MKFEKRDITEVTSGVIAHGCNCSGGFGTGVAGAIKKKWPHVAEAYHHLMKHDEHAHLGNIQIVDVGPNLKVANLLTQQNYGYDGKRYADPTAIATALNALIIQIFPWRMPLYVPRIGIKRGGLDWETEVKPIYESVAKLAETCRVDFTVCDWEG